MLLDSEESLILERAPVEINDFRRFEIREKNWARQFCSIYTSRLAALKQIVVEKATIKWGSSRPIVQIESLSEYEPNRDGSIIVVGTLYKHQQLKRSILKELSEEIQMIHQPSNYWSDTDKLFLEDTSLRTKLVGNHPNHRGLVTGIVCALLGHGTEDGSFWVDDYCFPGCCPPRVCDISPPRTRGKILLVSGLDMASSAESMSLDLLSEWISGMAGVAAAQRDEAAVLQVIIAGNSVRASPETHPNGTYEAKRAHSSANALESLVATHKFDCFLRTIVENCSVIVMPGQFDPSDHSLPQQPLHPCMLPKSSRYKSLRSVTNPWIGMIGERIVAGSSGQPIQDMMKVAGLEEATELHWLEMSLVWRHWAPTAPDTLPAYPYFGSDPFVMTECPDVYFAGNTDEYATKMLTGEEGQRVRLVCVPKFANTRTAVVVDLNSLDAWPISFGSS